VQVQPRGTPAQQIDSVATELARARAGENELLTLLAFDQQVHDFEKLGQLLDLVDDDLLLTGVSWGSRLSLVQRLHVGLRQRWTGATPALAQTRCSC
jgi:hypothetical protein